MFVYLCLYPLPFLRSAAFALCAPQAPSYSRRRRTVSFCALQHTHAPCLVGIFLPSWLKQHPSREKKQKMRIHIFTAFLLVLNVAASHSSPLHSHARKSFNGLKKRQLVGDLINGVLDGVGLGSGESARRCTNVFSDLCFRWQQQQQLRVTDRFVDPL